MTCLSFSSFVLFRTVCFFGIFFDTLFCRATIEVFRIGLHHEMHRTLHTTERVLQWITLLLAVFMQIFIAMSLNHQRKYRSAGSLLIFITLNQSVFRLFMTHSAIMSLSLSLSLT